MQEKLLSIVIPCYNSEEYLPVCLESIKKQTYQNFEVILVDDGSTDSTGDICDSWAIDDKRFRVLHISNSGSSVARRAGLERVDSKYVTFVDSDDFIHPDMYFRLMNGLALEKEADIMVCGVADFIDGKVCHRDCEDISDEYEIIDRRDAVLRILDGEEWKSYMVNKIYRTSLFDTISFPVNRNLDEDTSIMHLIFHNANTVLYNKSEFYYYRCHLGSICYSYDVKSMARKANDRIAARWERLQFTETHPEYHEMLNKQRNIYLAVGLAVMRIAAKYPTYFSDGFFEKKRNDIKSVIDVEYMAEYFNSRKKIELFVLKQMPFVFRLVYKFLPAW